MIMNVKLRNSVIKDNKRGRGDGRENKLVLLPYINNKKHKVINEDIQKERILTKSYRNITNYISPKINPYNL